MAETACTQELWQAVIGDNPSYFKGKRFPVEMVSWDDCKAFTEKLNEQMKEWQCCLPTEAQWEYACRAGTTTAFSFGDRIAKDQVNYDEIRQ
ncbi:formylglycine-generating enzyme family protein [Candidatus Uabimicrobium sp. HlEnr_7]|uniref:formylglycine-generating enzyme family protein n=1 Tax=Candidatus Uabimicrobium helgolandensis TaxID=3095367 RepID=UPI003557DD1D